MKYISFVVPCYNSSEYMKKCINSLLIGGNDIEIIIIDDGSIDDTLKIALEYEKKYPNIVKAIHQKNGGHGAGINTGLKYAKGKYFKVVDSDDWVDKKALKKAISVCKKVNSDLIVMNYVYTYKDNRSDRVVSFSNVFPSNKEISWDDIGRFKWSQYLSLHSLMYKLSVLKRARIKLPRHVFYEDNLFIYLPLPYTKTIYYIDVNFYRYFIGREDQSVQTSQIIKRSSHQVLVSREACNKYDLSMIKDKKLRNLMKRECIFLMSIGVVFSRLGKTKDGELQYKELWKSIKEGNPNLYYKIRYNSIATIVSLPTKLGRYIAIMGYKMVNKMVNFN